MIPTRGSQWQVETGVAARAGDGDAVQQLEEVERVEDGSGSAFLWWHGGPRMEGGLGTAEDFVDVLFRTELGLQLVAKVEALSARMKELDAEITANTRPVWQKK